MGLYLAGILIFMIFVLAAAGVMLWTLNKEPPKSTAPTVAKAKKQKAKKAAASYHHITELVNIKEIAPGIIYSGGKYLGYARVEGTNFSILSDGEQDNKEATIIALQNQLDFAQQYITSTIITDTERIAAEIREQALACANPGLAVYSNAYAASLEQMKQQRLAMTQVSWLVVSDTGANGDPVQNIRNKMAQLQELFRARVGIILTPLTNTGEVVDSLQQIMVPQRLTAASETAALGLNPIHFNIHEIENLI